MDAHTRARYILDAAKVLDNFLPQGNKPSNERQARQLARFF
jgi:hypothetical protein